MMSLDMIWNFKLIGLLGGIPLLIIWWLVIKGSKAMSDTPKLLLPTLLLGIPGLILLCVGIYLLVATSPMRANFFIANCTAKDGRVELEGHSYPVEVGSWEQIEFRTSAETFSVKGFVGDSLVFDTTMGYGSYIGTLGGDRYVSVDEWVYSRNLESVNMDDMISEILFSPGIFRFSEKLNPEIYGFDESAPDQIDVETTSGDVHAFDLSLITQEQVFKEYLSALAAGGIGYDSLMGVYVADSLALVDSLAGETQILEEGE